MTVDQKITSRIDELIAQSTGLTRELSDDPATFQAQIGSCKGWLGATQSIVELACPQHHPYVRQFDQIMTHARGGAVPGFVEEAASVLRHLLDNIKDGLITSIVDQAAAEAFDDFLDHGEAYLTAGRKDPAGVIAGVVFEDTIRRICRKNSISEADQKLDYLITELTKPPVLTATKAKRARAAAGVRTKATHAQWTEFDAADVESTIKLTRELLDDHLD
jgi:hypothetical protein